MAAGKILIVEDEAPIREMIAFHLVRAGFETVEAGAAIDPQDVVPAYLRQTVAQPARPPGS